MCGILSKDVYFVILDKLQRRTYVITCIHTHLPIPSGLWIDKSANKNVSRQRFIDSQFRDFWSFHIWMDRLRPFRNDSNGQHPDRNLFRLLQQARHNYGLSVRWKKNGILPNSDEFNSQVSDWLSMQSTIPTIEYTNTKCALHRRFDAKQARS